MRPRAAAHALDEIASLLELHGESRFRSRAWRTAARAIQALPDPDLTPRLRSGDLESVPGVGPAVLDVLRDLADTGDSEYLELLRENTPEGLLEMLRVPGLGTTRIHLIHEGLGVETLHELEQAARDGRLATLPGFGSKTAEKVLRGIAFLKAGGGAILFPHALAEAGRLLAAVRAHPDVTMAAIAGEIRRHCEIVHQVEIVAACRHDPARVAAAIAHAPGVRDAVGGGGPSVSIRWDDGTRLELNCVPADEYPVALWRATGSNAHVDAVLELATSRGFTLRGNALFDRDGRVHLPDERALYGAIGLPWVAPELREDRGEVDAAIAGELPTLVTSDDIRGVLHCHSRYSDGHASIAELADAALAQGWSYLGITDHSQSAFYAGGLERDTILRQHDEIDAVNARDTGVRVLKGIEADILPCGRVDYDAEVLDRFDYVIASVHSRFGMNEAQMTERILKALDDPHVTILGHPTGRLLLTREPYRLDIEAVLERAGEAGVAVELNADPHRLDLDWRFLGSARRHGVRIEIGPDAHSVQGLANMDIGIGIARKGGLSAADVLNTLDADGVVAFARARDRRAPAAMGQADGW
ncbi:MAG TPA: PHP domain-containing protein [Gemmatimonadaceae bacterium]|nr:PHP domain-containing protein [Gemmatimonadaceae bacterium]